MTGAGVVVGSNLIFNARSQNTTGIYLAKTNGFELIRNKRQLASYAGFDVREKQSGTSVKGYILSNSLGKAPHFQKGK